MTKKKYRFKRKPGMTEADTYANVEVSWIDIVSDASWLESKAFDKIKPAMCKTTGKVYNRAGGCTRIFADWSLDDDGNIDSYGNVTVIPNSVIKEIKIKK